MIRTEKEVCITLKKWFNNYDINCWMNEGENKFQTKISQKKCDLIIYSEKIKQYVAIEVKNGDISKDVHDASKIIGYWNDYRLGKIEYHINGEKIKVSSFCVATLYSMFGKLFMEDNEVVDLKNYKNQNWANINVRYNLEPKKEFLRTRDSLRRLWAEWRKIRDKKDDPGIGFILSEALNKSEYEIIDSPLMLDMQYETYNNKSQWRVRQKWL